MPRPSARLVVCLVLLASGALAISRPFKRPVLLPLEAGGSAAALESSPAPGGGPAEPRIEILPLPQGSGTWRELAKDTVHLYRVDLRDGEFVHWEILQRELDAAIEVREPHGGTRLKVDTLNGKNGPEDVPFIARQTGSHEIRISGLGRGEPRPAYRLRQWVRRQAIPDDRERADAALAYYEAEELRIGGAPRAKVEAGYEKAIRRARQVEDLPREADSSYWLGKERYYWLDLRGSRDAYWQALSAYRRLGNRNQQAVVLNNFGLDLEKLGEWEGALKAYGEAVDLARELGNPKAEMDALRNLGRLQFRFGEVGKALECFEQAFARAAEKKDIVQQVAILNARGLVYSRMGAIKEALKLHDEALSKLRESGLSADVKELKTGETLIHIADAYGEARSPELAIHYYRKALSLDNLTPESRASALNNLGLIYYDEKKFSEALDPYREALAIFREVGAKAEEVVALTNLGLVFNGLGRPNQALESLEQALPMARSLGQRPAEASIYYAMAWTERLRGNPIAARNLALRAVDMVELLRTKAEQRNLRMYFLASRQSFYSYAIDLLMEQDRLQPAAGFDRQAFEVSERARARALLDNLGASLASPISALSLPQIQKQVLDPGTVLLAYAFGETRSYCWVITPTSAESFELADKRLIRQLVDELYGLLLVSHRREDRKAASEKGRELSRHLLGAFARRLEGKRLLVVVPPELQPIPFAALPDPTLSGTGGDSWPTPLIVKHEIAVAPSASIVAALRQARRGRKVPPGLLALVTDPVYQLTDDRFARVFGDKVPEPDFLQGRFKRVPFADEEGEAVLRLAQKGKILVLSGFEANRDRVLDRRRPEGERLGFYRILHFRVHGGLNTKDPGLSSLVLSAFDEQGRSLNPFLLASDVEQMDLPVDLVVLSSCQTGLGMRVPGEGLVGLTQAFFSAGASTVVVSLWEVEGLSTSQLMTLFYENLLGKGLSPAAALREAQIALWRQDRWNAPSHWAGFTSMGEWR